MRQADRVIAGLATVFLATSLAACSGGGSIATVNGAPISKADFDAKLESGPQAVSTLQEMVREMLINQYAKQNNIVVSDADVQKREDAIKANFPGNSWSDMLKSRGLTENDVHQLLSQQVIIDKAVGGDLKVSEAQIKAYFDKNHAAFDKPAQVRARHILVADKATADKIEAQLKADPSKFDALAKQYSTDPGSKDKGGELGFFRQGMMTPTFDHYAFTGAVNAISEPIKSPFGWHIIQVEEKQEGSKATLANTHDKIEDTLRQQQEGPLIQPFMTNLQTKANIQVSDPRFQSAFPTPPPGAGTSPATASTP